MNNAKTGLLALGLISYSLILFASETPCVRRSRRIAQQQLFLFYADKNVSDPYNRLDPDFNNFRLPPSGTPDSESIMNDSANNFIKKRVLKNRRKPLAGQPTTCLNVLKQVNAPVLPLPTQQVIGEPTPKKQKKG